MAATINRNLNARGNVTIFSDDGTRVATAVATPESPLDHSLASFAEQHASEVKRLQPEALLDQMRRVARTTVFPVLAFERDEAAREKQAIAAAEGRLREPLPSITRDWFQADVDRLRGMSIGERSKQIDSASLSELTAYADAGQARTGLDDATWERADRRYVAATFIERVGLQSGYQLRPTVDAPFATGPDRAAAEAAANEALKAHDQRKAALDTREAQFRGILTFLGIALEMQPGEVLNEVIGA